MPDIGGFTNVPIDHGLRQAPATRSSKDAPLVELESEKATMEVPATHAGRIRDVKVRVGDKVSQGDVLAHRRDGRAAAAPAPARPRRPAAAPRRLPPGTRTAVAAPPHRAERAPRQRPTRAGASVHASPAIRRFARELGVALRGVAAAAPTAASRATTCRASSSER